MPSGGSVHAKLVPQPQQSPDWWKGIDYGDIIGGFGTLIQGRSHGKAGEAARAVQYANAADMLQLAGQNAARMQQVAGINASAVRNVGYANAAAIERTALRNGQLMMLEGAEALWRHVKEEQYMVGNIRAMQAATGWSVNEGTPRAYLNNQKALMYHDRKYLAAQQELSLFTMLMNAGDEASVTRYGADQSANAIMATAALEKEIMLSEAAAQARQMRRMGDLYYLQGKSKKKSGLFGSIGRIGGAIVGNLVGGKVGGQIGGQLGGALGGQLD
jgi:hypothetical protein